MLSGKDVFLNTIALVMYRYGIAGLALYLSIFRKKLFSVKYEARIYAIMMIVASFGQGFISSPSIPLIILLLYANKMHRSEILSEGTVNIANS